MLKILNFKNRNREKPVKQNGHFGKIISALIFTLFVQVFVMRVPISEATSHLYYYDKYRTNAVPYYTTQKSNTFWLEIGYMASDDNGWSERGFSFYSNYTLNNETGLLDPAGTYYRRGAMGNSDAGRYAFETRDSAPLIYEVYVGNERSKAGKDWYEYQLVKEIKVVTNYNYVRGDYISRITGTETQYPINGRHADGYWYIRRELVNKNPILNIVHPTENKYFV